MSADHFAVGKAIVERLRTTVPELRQVRLAASMQEIADWQPSSPAAWVVWDGDPIADTAGRGQAQIVRQRWIVALIVRSAKESQTGSGVIESAGPLITRILETLMGWTPPGPVGCRPLERIEAPRPGYGSGYGFFPVAFTAAIPLKGD